MNLREVDALYPAWAADNLRVLSKESGYVPFRFNPIQRRQWTSRLATSLLRDLVLKARQIGLTTLYLGSHIQRCQFIDGYRVAIVALKGKDGAEPIAQAMSDMLSMQPKSWIAHAPRLTNDTDTLLRWANGSEIRLFTAGGGEIGRSLPFHRLHFTEYGKYPDPETTRAAILPALAPNGEQVIESTASGFNHFELLVREAMTDEQPLFNFSFYPWFQVQEYQEPPADNFEPTAEEAALMAEHSLTPAQVQWRRTMVRELPVLFPQEYPATPDEAFLAAGDSWFAYDVIEAARSTTRPPIRIEEDGLLHVFEEPQAGVSYVIGADAAEGVPKGDLSAATVRRAATGTQVATLTDDPPSPASRERRMTTTIFPKKLSELGRRYNDAGIMVEKNHPGPAVNDALANVHRYPNLLRFEGEYGIRTNVATKPVLQQQYRDGLQTQELTTRDARIVKQMSNFIVLSPERQSTSGRKLAEVAGARPGTHDDLLMADMICAFARSRALAATLKGPTVVRWR